MGSIADKMNYLLETKKGIREAIAAKGVSISDGDTFRSYADKIASIEQGGVSSPENPTTTEVKDVNFYDYNGDLLYSFTTSEVEQMTALPPLPQQNGLICQGWSHNLEDIILYKKHCNVGASYITDDGKTRLYINMMSSGIKEVPLYFQQTVANGVIINWGDGNSESIDATGRVTTSHMYNNAGRYIITLEVVSGELQLGYNNKFAVVGDLSDDFTATRALLECVEIGSNVTQIGDYAFYKCYGLKKITIPQGVTYIGTYALAASGIPVVILPMGMTTIGQRVCQDCKSLSLVIEPATITTYGVYTYYSAYGLKDMVISRTVNKITNAYLCRCYSIPTILIPGNVIDIGTNAFSYPFGTIMFDFREHTSVPTIVSNSFDSMNANCKIVVPDSLYDQWIAATNWCDIADKIVRLSDYNN